MTQKTFRSFHARKSTVVVRGKGVVCGVRVSEGGTRDGELAQPVAEAAQGWQIEELQTEEGRLDEVFRSITMPDTAKEDQRMNAWANIKTIAKRELGVISRRRWPTCSS